ncbi:MAG TPA: DUF423 domain-containing protein [Burkholderiaceae bacterium]|nr:DUF423 domain-containing protein [Burkholderiaceae bacterium]
MERWFALLGTLSALVGVAAGAAGAHALRGLLGYEAAGWFETAVRYQLFHALALFAVAWVHSRWPGRLVIAAGWLFVVGTVFFSGSLYVLAIAGRQLWFITPLGGVCFLLGWVLLAVALGRRRG